MASRAHRPTRILMVDDNPTDTLLMRRALLKIGLPHDLSTALDGQAAMEHLSSAIELSNSHLPDLILLDLNMPKKDGFAVLKELKQHEILREIPVVIYSSSTYQDDIKRCYAMQASSYVSKPVGYPELLQIVSTLGQYWCGVVTLPE